MTINERFNEIIRVLFKGNKRAFAQCARVSPSVIENVVGSRGGKPSYDVLEKICANANVSAEWLLLGRGEMTRYPEYQIAPLELRDTFALRTDRPLAEQRVPLYELGATAGLVALFVEPDRKPVNYISIPNLPQCDGALYVCGDSMYPLLKSGDIVLYKQVTNYEYGIFWGEMYLVSFEMDGEEFVCIKYLQRGQREGFVRLVSYNQHYDPQEIPMDRIRALALIKASIRYNTMG